MRAAPYTTPEDLEVHTASWLHHVRSRVAPRPQLQLRPDRCALVVVDMVRYFAHPEGRCFLPAVTAVLPRVRALVDAWRALGSPVVFTRHGHTGEHDLGPLGRFFSDWIHADEPDAALLDGLAPHPDELCFRKTTYDAFLHTPLQGWLEERGVEQVLVTGVLTHMCCETTARSAFCRGFGVWVAADATASSTEELHLGSLTGLADSVAVVLSTGEVIERCAKSTS